MPGNMTVERLRLNLRFSHGFISVQNIILASLNHTSIGTVSVNGYLWESKYCWTTLGHDLRNSPLEGLTIDLTQTIHLSMDKTIEEAND